MSKRKCECGKQTERPDTSRCRTCRRNKKAQKAVRRGGPRVLLIDIETSLQLSYHFGMWNVNISPDMVVEPTRMLCFAAKWLGEDEVIFRSEHEHGRLHMVVDAWGLLDQADAVVHYYGSRFDVPHLNREFLEQGFGPPSPYKQIDLKMAVSKRFKFPSNKLQFVSQALGFEGKEQTGGMGLWRKCQEGDPAAWKKMQSYNEQDTRLLEDVYGRLLPWIPALPNRHLFEDGGACPNCGDGPVDRDGVYRTALSVFPQYRCRACESWLRGSKRVSGAKLQAVAL